MSRDQQTREQTPRRDFLKTVSAAAATSGLLAGSVAGAENEPTASPLP
ncbi:MAG: twin-arginine translocation signal domain-containing protein, partial [Planctomycetes bacterium]|nr:twin-arginine translocation signal domain-containing protein [Planctomycetota bacterium]